MKAPFAIVKLVNKETEIDLTDHLTSFSYEDCIAIDSLLKITVAPDNLIDMIDNGIIATGCELVFYFGYLGAVQSHVHKVDITDIDIDYGAGGKPTVTLTALGKSAILKKAESIKVWGVDKETTITDIVSTIAKKYGMKYAVEETSTKYKNVPQKGLVI
jgi:phage protein D